MDTLNLLLIGSVIFIFVLWHYFNKWYYKTESGRKAQSIDPDNPWGLLIAGSFAIIAGAFLGYIVIPFGIGIMLITIAIRKIMR